MLFRSTFTWRSVDGAARYDLWVNQVGGRAQILRQQNLSGTSYTPADLLPAGGYRAWIRAISSTGEASPWSLEITFTVTGIVPSDSSTRLVAIPEQSLSILQRELFVDYQGERPSHLASPTVHTRDERRKDYTLGIDYPDAASQASTPILQAEVFNQVSNDECIAAAISDWLETPSL